MRRKKNPSAGSFVGGMVVGALFGAAGMALYNSSKKTASVSAAPINSGLTNTNQFAPYSPREIT